MLGRSEVLGTEKRPGKYQNLDINEVSVFAVIANPNPRTLTLTLKRTGFIHDELPRGTGNVGRL